MAMTYAEGEFDGEGVFQGEGFCEGGDNSTVTTDRATAAAAGLPDSIILGNPAAGPAATS